MTLKKIAFFIFIIFSLFVINDLVNSIYNLWQKQDLLESAKRTLRLEKKKNIELKKELKEVNKVQFVEEEARNKLFLVRPGEGIVSLPSIALKNPSPSAAPKPDAQPNWLKWWEMFFGN